jgi:hypothetical protein
MIIIIVTAVETSNLTLLELSLQEVPGSILCTDTEFIHGLPHSLQTHDGAVP